tara:strand:- start:1 stop:225 length:225 start_codon:yes stop_codon:yes gene_type:complete
VDQHIVREIIGRLVVQHINKMKKIIIIVGVLLTTSCGTFSKMTDKEKELQYQIDKAYFEYSHKRDSLILEHYRK